MFGGGGGNGAPMMGGPSSGAYGPPGNGPYDQEQGQGQNPGYGQPPPGTGYGGQPGGPPGYNNGPAYGSPPQQGNAPPVGYKMPGHNPMNLLWFAASCCVMFGSMISFVQELFSLQWIDALEMVYIFIFGLLLAVLDTPFFNQVSIVSELRAGISKYIAALQRVTGKGLAYIFLGCALWSSMFANVTGVFLLTVATLLGLFTVFIGIFSTAIAFCKSRNLDLVRVELRKEPMSLKQMYDMHAKMNPMAGITQEEFKKMTPYARGVSFENSDIKVIFNALSSNPKRDVISLDDLTGWVNGSMMVFI